MPQLGLPGSCHPICGSSADLLRRLQSGRASPLFSFALTFPAPRRIDPTASTRRPLAGRKASPVTGWANPLNRSLTFHSAWSNTSPRRMICAGGIALGIVNFAASSISRIARASASGAPVKPASRTTLWASSFEPPWCKNLLTAAANLSAARRLRYPARDTTVAILYPLESERVTARLSWNPNEATLGGATSCIGPATPNRSYAPPAVPDSVA
jgi:hypothetical protein